MMKLDEQINNGYYYEEHREEISQIEDSLYDYIETMTKSNDDTLENTQSSRVNNSTVVNNNGSNEKTLTLWLTRVALFIGVIMLLSLVVAAWKPLWLLAKLPYVIIRMYFAVRTGKWFIPFSRKTTYPWYGTMLAGLATLLMWVAGFSWVALITK